MKLEVKVLNISIYEQTKSAIAELCETAKLKKGNIVIIGCSTSEVVGSKIGTNSNVDVAKELFDGMKLRKKKAFILQCSVANT